MLTYAFVRQQLHTPSHAVEKIHCHGSERKKFIRFFIAHPLRADLLLALLQK
jgi:hypothetical protein